MWVLLKQFKPDLEFTVSLTTQEMRKDDLSWELIVN